MSANVKPLTHWAIYKGYRLRFRSRAPDHVIGVLTNAEGVEMAFDYLPAERVVKLARAGWLGTRRSRRRPPDHHPRRA